ncbi:ABC transporter substrate-binding protein [Spiractinospora alimapuensis]|uniref:ABC transporter substrate-binding protein n=1 Tax=Spiractinospora alimapuensis TaxID=2820884 RepID=UPI001F3EE873|nr:ABC transporter substrate-binding protein [Spiractinospora alimapuensis]QVQ52763.1 ABC transporter substrate-binding protein [Spiractinospora alimapuensis]
MRERTVTIGVHPNNHTLFVLRRLSLLEEELGSVSATVEWVDYDDGRCTIDLFAEEEIDFGGTGSVPPIEAQSDGLPIVYVATSPPRPTQGALLVHADGPLHSVADVAGARVALMEGSYHTELLAYALDTAGLTYDAVTPVDGLAHENRADFLAGRADAWIAGDPYLAELQRGSVPVRALTGTADHIANRSYWWARRSFAETSRDVLNAIVVALGRAEEWIQRHPRDAAALFTDALPESPSLEAWERTLRRRAWGNHPVAGEPAREQQRSADLFARLGIIDGPVTVSGALVDPVPALWGTTP